MGIAFEPSLSLITHLQNLIIGKDGLITDYFIKGSCGAAFVNAGLVGVIGTKLLSLSKSTFRGIDMGAVMLALGFAFFGKNIFNIWTIILGGYIYSRINHVEMKNVIPISLFATSLAPLTTEILFVFDMNLALRITLFVLVGITIGYVVNIVATHTKSAHKGYNLYNVGFAIGLIGTAFVSIFRSYGFEISSHLQWDTDKHRELYIIFAILFFVIGIYAYVKAGSLDRYKQLLKTTGKDCDYIESFGLETTLINFSTTGLFTLLVIYLLDIPLNGPILGGVLTIVGFTGAGKHVRNITPVFIGVLIASYTNVWNVTDPSVALTMMFLTGLAPICGTFGMIPGIIFTYVNVSIALNTGVLHGGLNLYNTGFSIGITSAILVPIYEHIQNHFMIQQSKNV